MKTQKNAFTMIELVFVIVVLGILAAVAVPKFAATRVDAQVSKGRADVSSLRSSIISERQSRLIKGDSSWITKLDHAASNNAGVVIFDSNETLSATSPQLLSYGVTTNSSSGHWMKTGTFTYTYKVGNNAATTFTYYPVDTTGTPFHPAGTFDCDHSVETCRQLAQ